MTDADAPVSALVGGVGGVAGRMAAGLSHFLTALEVGPVTQVVTEAERARLVAAKDTLTALEGRLTERSKVLAEREQDEN